MNDMLSVWIASGSLAVATLGALIAALRPYRDPVNRSLASKVASLRSDLDELEEILKRLDARDRMRRVRAGRAESAESSSATPTKAVNHSKPDPMLDPQGWKRYMREKHPAIGPHNPPKDENA
jgi:hypothetical protein